MSRTAELRLGSRPGVPTVKISFTAWIRGKIEGTVDEPDPVSIVNESGVHVIDPDKGEIIGRGSHRTWVEGREGWSGYTVDGYRREGFASQRRLYYLP